MFAAATGLDKGVALGLTEEVAIGLTEVVVGELMVVAPIVEVASAATAAVEDRRWHFFRRLHLGLSPSAVTVKEKTTVARKR